MKTKTIVFCIVALLLGMLLANILKNICGCNTVVEGAESPPFNVGCNNDGATFCALAEIATGPKLMNNPVYYCQNTFNDDGERAMYFNLNTPIDQPPGCSHRCPDDNYIHIPINNCPLINKPDNDPPALPKCNPNFIHKNPSAPNPCPEGMICPDDDPSCGPKSSGRGLDIKCTVPCKNKD